MADLIDELVRVPEHLVRDPGDEAEPGDETLHLVLLDNLDLVAQLLLEHLVELVCAASGCHDLDPSLHLCDRDPVELGRLGDQLLDERHAEVDLGRLEPSKVEQPTGQVG